MAGTGTCCAGDIRASAVSRQTYPGRVEGYWAALIWSILPTLVVSAVFFFVLRGIIRMDRTERRVYAQIEAEERAKRGMTPAPEDPRPTAH